MAHMGVSAIVCKITISQELLVRGDGRAGETAGWIAVRMACRVRLRVLEQRSPTKSKT